MEAMFKCKPIVHLIQPLWLYKQHICVKNITVDPGTDSHDNYIGLASKLQLHRR